LRIETGLQLSLSGLFSSGLRVELYLNQGVCTF